MGLYWSGRHHSESSFCGADGLLFFLVEWVEALVELGEASAAGLAGEAEAAGGGRSAAPSVLIVPLGAGAGLGEDDTAEVAGLFEPA